MSSSTSCIIKKMFRDTIFMCNFLVCVYGTLSIIHLLPVKQVDAVQALIRDRVAVANSQEAGRDLEHCVLLSRKFDEFQTVCVLKECLTTNIPRFLSVHSTLYQQTYFVVIVLTSSCHI